MLKFFLNIRRNLFTNGSKSKYMKYAVGEILLLVIEILIALQINNWNESRKNKTLVNTYKKSLIENLVKGSLNIHNKLVEINEDLKQIEDFEYRVSKSNEPFDTFLNIARKEYEFRVNVMLDFEDNTYQILNSTGHLALFSPKLAKHLNSLYSLQENALQASKISLDNYKNVLTNYSRINHDKNLS